MTTKTFLILATGLFVAAQLSGCKIFGGITAHSKSMDSPEYSGNNPLGFIRAETDDGLLFCQHTSSIPDLEKGYGLNTCGIQTRLY